MEVSVSRIEFKDLEKMMNQNDVEGIAAILEGANFRLRAEDEFCVIPFSNREEIASTILGYAVMLAEKDKLSDEMTAELVYRIGRAVNTIGMLRMIRFFEEHFERLGECAKILEWVRETLEKEDPEYEPSIESFIAECTDEVFKSTINYCMSGKVKRLNSRYNPTLIHGMWRRGLVSKRRIITLMAIFLKKDHGGLESLLGGSLAAAMFFGAPIFP